MAHDNPFEKPLQALTATDLVRLGELAEGWYVEYKREVPAPKDIAKSVCAFANHFGGVLVIGVESPDGQPPSGFPGVSLEEGPKYQARIRDAIAQNTHPLPYFAVVLVPGPNEEIGLGPDRGLIVVSVPSGADPPYVHSSGRVYRRAGDRSDPVFETDRVTLDRLHQRGATARAKLAAFLAQDIPVAERRTTRTIMIVYVMSQPLELGRQSVNLSFSAFSEIARGTNTPGCSIPCDIAFSTSDGYIARQVFKNAPRGPVPTLRFYLDGTTVFWIPLRQETIESPEGRWNLKGYSQSDEFLRLCLKRGYGSTDWIDVNLLPVILSGVLAKHRALLNAVGRDPASWCKVRFCDTWHKIPFVDTKHYLEAIEDFGVPIVHDSELFSPPGPGLEGLTEVLDGDPEGGYEAGAIAAWVQCLYGFGLASQIYEESIEGMLRAAARSEKIHRGEDPTQP